MKLDLRDLIAGTSDVMSIDYQLTPEFDTADPRSNLFGVSFPSKMTVSGRVTNNAGYMRLTLKLCADYVASCARCLEDVKGRFDYDFEKTVALASVINTLDEDKRDEYVIVDDGFVDIDEQLLELFELNFPTKILCREDCRGLCPRCGKNLNTGDCGCIKKEIDPRMLPLQQLLEKMKKEEK